MTNLVREALELARRTLQTAGAGGREPVRDERTTDISTVGDRMISAALVSFFRSSGLKAAILSEESGAVGLGGQVDYTIVIDDLDGTGNWHRGGDLLPFCTVVAVMHGPTPRLRDTLVAGIIEHRTGRTWTSEAGHGTRLDDVSARVAGRTAMDRETLVVVDHYGSGDAVGRLAQVHSRAWVKDFGSSALHLAGVSSGIFDAFVNAGQKGHELAAGWLLVTEAGGTVVDFSSRPISDSIFDMARRYQVVACCTPELAREICGALAR